MNAAQEMAAKRWAKPDARDKQRKVIEQVNKTLGLGKGSRKRKRNKPENLKR